MTAPPDDVNQFLDRFAHVPDYQEYMRLRSDGFEDLPTDQQYYLRLARQLFPGSIEDWEIRPRFVRILSVLLRRDGRTFDALMHIASIASQHPDGYDTNGTNALAGIYVYLRWNRSATIPGPAACQAFHKFAAVPEIAHNAENICRLVDERGWCRDDIG